MSCVWRATGWFGEIYALFPFCIEVMMARTRLVVREKILLGELGQDERWFVHGCAVVFEKFCFLLWWPSSQRTCQINVWVFGANDVANLTTWIGRYARVSILHLWVQGSVVLKRALDILNVQPHAFSLSAKNAVLGHGAVESFEKFVLEQRFGRTLDAGS